MRPDMPAHVRGRFWSRARLWFRCLRLLVWLGVLAVVAGAIYLNQEGLPEVLNRPLCEQLRQRGVEFEFSRLRWQPPAGIVADQVRVGGPADSEGPQMSARRAEMDLAWRELLRGRLQVEALGLRDGHFIWPLTESNAPPETISLDDLQARLRLLPDDEWVVEDFRARFSGVRLFLAGTVTNASALRDWALSRPRPTGRAELAADDRVAPGTARHHLRQLAGVLRRVTFRAPPDLRLVLTGDARLPETFALRMSAVAPAVESPWGSADGVLVNLRLFAATALRPARLQATLEADEARLPRAQARQLDLQLGLDAVSGQAGLIRVTLDAQAAEVLSQWAAVTNLAVTADWTHPLTNAVPLTGRLEARAATASNRWAVAQDLEVMTSLAAAASAPRPEPAQGWWTNLLPYHLSWGVTTKDLRAGGLPPARLTCAGYWSGTELAVTNLDITASAGHCQAEGGLDLPGGAARASVRASTDLRELRAWLPAVVRDQLERGDCSGAAWVTAGVAVELPAWLTEPPDWRVTLPTVRLAGELTLTNTTCSGLSANWGRARFAHTNRLWLLPEVVLARADGKLHAGGQWQADTGAFEARLQSTLPPELLRPLLMPAARRALDFFSFSQPPVVNADLAGRLDALDQTTVRAGVAITNFSFRDAPISAFTAELAYRERQLELIEPRVWRGTNHLRAARVRADFVTERVHLTDARGCDDPQVVTRAIGPKTARALQPYQFASPPEVRLDGTIPMRGHAGADLWVEVRGGPFAWWKFRVPAIQGTVHWQGKTVALTNVTMGFYGGSAHGWGVFDSQPAVGTDCRFALSVSNADFHELMSDLTSPTNRLEGTLSARLTVTGGNTADWHSWQGAGEAQLQEGWIWSIPLFGVLSDPLDSIVPGLGNSRVTSGSGTFALRNGVVFSDDLEWRAQTMRLQYQGTVDLQGVVNATVQAELLRDTWLVGRLVSLALWPVSKILEFKVTGTLGAPRAEPLFIPRLLTVPLRPWQTLKDLFAPNGNQPQPPADASKR